MTFSSTACMLRHEREAHGMHGHGPNPHKCIFPDCERSVEGHGFPRRWNLHDHMRRVHNYSEPSSPKNGNESPSPPHHGSAGHKKRSPSPRAMEANKRVKISSTDAKSVNQGESLLQAQQEKIRLQVYEEHKLQMEARLRVLGPTNAFFESYGLYCPTQGVPGRCMSEEAGQLAY